MENNEEEFPPKGIAKPLIYGSAIWLTATLIAAFLFYVEWHNFKIIICSTAGVIAMAIIIMTVGMALLGAYLAAYHDGWRERIMDSLEKFFENTWIAAVALVVYGFLLWVLGLTVGVFIGIAGLAQEILCARVFWFTSFIVIGEVIAFYVIFYILLQHNLATAL